MNLPKKGGDWCSSGAWEDGGDGEDGEAETFR